MNGGDAFVITKIRIKMLAEPAFILNLLTLYC